MATPISTPLQAAYLDGKGGDGEQNGRRNKDAKPWELNGHEPGGPDGEQAFHAQTEYNEQHDLQKAEPNIGLAQ
jgi:hypothetical protein